MKLPQPYDDSIRRRLLSVGFSDAAASHVIRELSFWDESEPDGECYADSQIHLVSFAKEDGTRLDTGVAVVALSPHVADQIAPDMVLRERVALFAQPEPVPS